MIHDLFRAIHPEKCHVPIRLLMLSRVVYTTVGEMGNTCVHLGVVLWSGRSRGPSFQNNIWQSYYHRFKLYFVIEENTRYF